MSHIHGDPVQFEFSSADATTPAAISLRKAGGSAISALQSDERLIIETVSYSLAAAVLHAEIIDDADAGGDEDAGEMLVAMGIGGTSVSFVGIDHGTACGLGRIPKVIAAIAGAVRIAGTGRIIKG